MTKLTMRMVLFAASLALSACASVAFEQPFKGASTGGKTVQIGAKQDGLGAITITIDGAPVAEGRITPMVGSSSTEFAGEYRGKPVKAQCRELPTQTRKITGANMVRCSVSVADDPAVVLELYNTGIL